MSIGEQIIAAFAERRLYFVKFRPTPLGPVQEDASGVELSAAMKQLEAVVEAHIQERVRVRLELDRQALRAPYDELLYAVATKHDNETRHETALRYILERENRQPSEAAEKHPETPPRATD